MATQPATRICSAGCGKELDITHKNYAEGICIECLTKKTPTPCAGGCGKSFPKTAFFLGELCKNCYDRESSTIVPGYLCTSCKRLFPVEDIVPGTDLCGVCNAGAVFLDTAGMTVCVKCQSLKPPTEVNKDRVCRACEYDVKNCVDCQEEFHGWYLARNGGQCETCADKMRLKSHRANCIKCEKEVKMNILLHNGGRCEACLDKLRQEKSPQGKPKVVYNPQFDAHHKRMCRIAAQIELLSQSLELELEALEVEGSKDSELYQGADKMARTLYSIAKEISYNYDMAEPRIDFPSCWDSELRHRVVKERERVTGRDMSKMKSMKYYDE